MSEKPVERLNYYNGQRLEARDFKLEQEYHIRVRRWLNKSLYSPGIARGLEVREEQGTLNVIVSPGLALDAEGREILLWEEERVPVQSYSGSSDAVVEGNYLVIEYREEKLEEEKSGCTPRRTGTAESSLAWGGPARIRAKPKLSWSSVLPYETSGKVVLAQVELEPGCAAIHQINTGVRRYVGAASESKVHQFALDGEKHIDASNPAHIYFHIRGRQPNAVTLYLRAERFSTLYYTEMGRHDHAINVNGSVTIPSHSHTLTPVAGQAGTGPAGGHTHTISDIRARSKNVTLNVTYGIEITPAVGVYPDQSLKSWTQMAITFDPLGDHSHSLPAATDAEPERTLQLSGSGGAGAAGVTDVPARTGTTEKALTYLDNLQVSIGKSVPQAQNKTDDILRQLRAAQSSVTWDKLGNGSGNHVLAMKGSGAIKLDFLPDITFTEGEYVIELSVASGGGRILYNLYVE